MNKYNVPKEEHKDIRKGIKDKDNNSSSNFSFKISYFKVNRTYWADIAEQIVIYYPIIATVAAEVDNKIYIFDINLYDSNNVTSVVLFCVVHWDITTPQETINLNKILKSFEGSGIENYIEEITEEEYNYIKNQV